MLCDYDEWLRQARRMLLLGGWSESGRSYPVGQLLYLWTLDMGPGDAAVLVLGDSDA